MTHTPQRGFTLLIAVVLASVALAIGLALLDITYKQVVLASSSRQSQIAFYNADAVMECALYFDQVQNLFARTSSSGNVSCNGLANSVIFTNSGNPYIRTFTATCAGGGTAGYATIYKYSDATTRIFTGGYNTCDIDNPRRIERGLKISY
ncbi:hypothetical protein L0Y34_01785 [Candidatus Parcubacteria bacterium]|nr:hypothetical protein [Candidatus Parcubacteria bacterium]